MTINVNREAGDVGITTVPAGVLTAISNWFTSAGLGISTSCRMTLVQFNEIDSSGHYTFGYSVQEPVSYDGGHTGGSEYPLQIALVNSFRTGLRGPSRRGRIYLPCPAFPMLGDRRISNTNAAGVAITTSTFLGDLIAQSYTPVVASSKGYSTPITEVAVGTVYDTVRRRRDDLDENYQVHAV